ncbi:MAG: cytochrome c [Vicinamibacterales bacterium]
MTRQLSFALAAATLMLAPTTAFGQDAAKGQEVYTAQKCSLCHAVAGKGNAKGPLDGVASKYKADELREWVVNAKEMSTKHNATRKPAMKDFSSLPKADVDNLVAYLQTLKK